MNPTDTSAPSRRWMLGVGAAAALAGAGVATWRWRAQPVLPPALQDANPLGLERLVDGLKTREPLVR